MTASWKDPDVVAEYTGRVGRLAARQAGEVELLDALADAVTTIVDLGCGDGRLIELVLDAHPEITQAIGLDNSPPMSTSPANDSQAWLASRSPSTTSTTS